MPSCCDGEGYEAVFTDRFARRRATRYRRHGLDATSSRIVEFVSAHDIQGATVLEIGGGVGEIQLELLRRGAARATNLEISRSYEKEARGLLESSGLTDRVTRRFVNIAESPGDVDGADIVVLHRVVCCYPDYERLLSAAGSHARRLLVFSHPPHNVVSRALVGAENLVARLRRRTFRAFVHPAEPMESVLASTGLSRSYEHRGRAWRVVGLERPPLSGVEPRLPDV